ncbi:hypothetical protein MSAN_01020100 [Mycena sanguinolenta]|uniref:Uncharacterized protein n=1 Tax=Mycena sanguinolenta TaxID=230812 RepID=A0A8H6YM41_9AGAR|nr:hypothetical protein MSAN_01020100 [Mycena sanguinolenta]
MRDGRTGVSLSRVSQYIRNTSELARYTSIVLRGPAQIFAFAQFVAEHTHLKLKTRYLFIDGQESEEELERVAYLANAGTREAQREYTRLAQLLPPTNKLVQEAEDAVIWESANATAILGREGARAVESILRTLGPTLEILDISLNKYVAEMLRNPISLPRLVDLPTRCGFPLRPCDVPALEPTNSLRYLHVVDTTHQWHFVERFFENGISYFAPSLVQLRLLDLYQDEEVTKHLECALGHSDDLDFYPPSQVPQLPPTLELVILRPALEPKHNRRCEPSARAPCDELRDYDDLMCFARWLRDKDDRVMLLKAAASTPVEEFREWLDKVDGTVCDWDILTSELDFDSTEEYSD